MLPIDEVEKLRTALSESEAKNVALTKDFANAQAERDLLAVMLNEAEGAAGQSDHSAPVTASEEGIGGWTGNNKEAGSVATFANLPVGVLVLSPRGKIKTASSWAKKITGYSRTQLLEKEIVGLFTAIDIFREIESLADGGSAQMIEARLKHKDGKSLLVGLIVSPRHGDDLLITIVDLENRRLLEA